MIEALGLMVDSLRESWELVVIYFPRFVLAIVPLIVGWLLARGARALVVRLLRLLRLDSVAERTGLDDFLLRGGVRFTLATLVAQVVYWGVLLIFTFAAFNVLGLAVGPEVFQSLTGHIPNIAASLVVLVIGSIGARFIRGFAETYLNNIGVSGAANIGFLLHVALLVFVVSLALEQLGLAVTLLTSAFQLAFGGLCLALAIAFGMGGRAWAESILTRMRSGR